MIGSILRYLNEQTVRVVVMDQALFIVGPRNFALIGRERAGKGLVSRGSRGLTTRRVVSSWHDTGYPHKVHLLSLPDQDQSVVWMERCARASKVGLENKRRRAALLLREA